MKKIKLDSIKHNVTLRIKDLHLDIYCKVDDFKTVGGIMPHLLIKNAPFNGANKIGDLWVASTHNDILIGVASYQGYNNVSCPLLFEPPKVAHSRGINLRYRGGSVLAAPNGKVPTLKKHILQDIVLQDSEHHPLIADDLMKIIKIVGEPDTYDLKGYTRTRDVYVY